jgi:CD109 antigen
MTIKVEYDRTQLASNDIINVNATVTNNRRGKAKMIIVDLGLPPGFTLIPDKLNSLVESEIIEKYSTTGRQIIVYLREAEHGKPIEIKYQLLAKYPLKAKTPKSAVYEYYNPDVRVEAEPIQLVVSKD